MSRADRARGPPYWPTRLAGAIISMFWPGPSNLAGKPGRIGPIRNARDSLRHAVREQLWNSRGRGSRSCGRGGRQAGKTGQGRADFGIGTA
ncbi:unnamed protein product [Ciceribacter sp. T2.26MG-112.2]|nr:unnamed protein product [Ciceribacter naphthalenivorans]